MIRLHVLHQNDFVPPVRNSPMETQKSDSPRRSIDSGSVTSVTKPKSLSTDTKTGASLARESSKTMRLSAGIFVLYDSYKD